VSSASIAHGVGVIFVIGEHNIETRLNDLVWRIVVETKAVALLLESMHDLSKFPIHASTSLRGSLGRVLLASLPACVEAQQVAVVELAVAG
jgi:hypothetical protein